MMEFDLEYTLGLFPILLKYLGTTMEMALWGFVLALVLSLALAMVRVFASPRFTGWRCSISRSFGVHRYSFSCSCSTTDCRNCSRIFVGMDAFTAAIVGLTLHFAAYMAESIRAAILGIHKSQMEAALSIGMSRYQAMQRIILPQAARIATPSLMNYFIDMIKSTSLAFTLGVAEIMGKAQMEASSSFKFFESFMAVALIYWVVVIFFTRLQHLLEVRLNRAY